MIPEAGLLRGRGSEAHSPSSATRVIASSTSVVQQARLMDSAGTAWHAVKCGNLEVREGVGGSSVAVSVYVPFGGGGDSDSSSNSSSNSSSSRSKSSRSKSSRSSSSSSSRVVQQARPIGSAGTAWHA